MNVTMLVLNNFTHDARVHREAKTLAVSGYDVMVLALHRSGLPLVEQVDGYRVKRLELASRNLRGGRFAPLLKYLDMIFAVARVTKLRPADVYHSHDGNSLLATYPVVKRDHAAWVYDSHELERGRNIGSTHLVGIYRCLWSFPERLFIRRVNAVISANPSYASQLVTAYSIQPPVVVMNCPEYTVPPESSLLHNRIGAPANRMIALYQGAVVPGRGIEVCIRSLKYTDLEIDFVVLGDGRARGDLVALASELGLSDRVHFLGFVPLESLLAYTASADIGLSLIQNTCLSYYYSLPNKVLEYVMAGLPVVASDFPEMRRIVQEYKVGEVVHDPSSPQQVGAAMEKILADSSYCQQIQVNARRAAKFLNWEREEENLLALYAEIRATLRGK